MRLFIGVELEDVVKAAAADAAERLRQRLERNARDVQVRWIAPENLHITLWFIGEVAEATGEAIAEALKSPPVDVPAFTVSIAGCGAFPPSGQPRVFWIGVHEGLADMRRLYEDVGRRLAPLGFEPERRDYSPHLTIARVKDSGRGSGRAVRKILSELPAECGTSRIAFLTLFRSRLSPKGATYEPLVRVPLS